MSGPRMAYDPIPDLAQLLSALRTLPGPEYRGDTRAVLSGLVHGPVARLTAGLRLDDPAVLARGTEEAIYEAVQGFITTGGHLLTRAELDKLTAEAERGYDLDELPPIPGHAGPGHTVDGPADCPRCQLLRENQGWMERQQALADAVRNIPRLSEVRTVLSTVLSPEDYAELAELIRENAHWLATAGADADAAEFRDDIMRTRHDSEDPEGI